MENYGLNFSFALMPGSMQVVQDYWDIVVTAAKSPSGVIRKVVIQGLILLKQCVKLAGLPETSLRHMRDKENVVITEALQILHAHLFTPASLISILENLISLFFVLNADDIKEWDTVC